MRFCLLLIFIASTTLYANDFGEFRIESDVFLESDLEPRIPFYQEVAGTRAMGLKFTDPAETLLRLEVSLGSRKVVFNRFPFPEINAPTSLTGDPIALAVKLSTYRGPPPRNLAQIRLRLADGFTRMVAFAAALSPQALEAFELRSQKFLKFLAEASCEMRMAERASTVQDQELYIELASDEFMQLFHYLHDQR